jgi:hypothetical protein
MYVNPRAIFRNWQTSWQLVQALFEKIPAEIRDKIQVVAGPVTGGVVLARDLSGLTSTNRDLKLPGVETVFLSPSEGGYEITPSDQKILEEKNVFLVVDDVCIAAEQWLFVLQELWRLAVRSLLPQRSSIEVFRHFLSVAILKIFLWRNSDPTLCIKYQSALHAIQRLDSPKLRKIPASDRGV